jgi:hypothetical protein
MARSGRGLSKVSPGPAMPYPSTPCGPGTPEKALRPFQWWAHPPSGRPAGRLYPIGHPTPYAFGPCQDACFGIFHESLLLCFFLPEKEEKGKEERGKEKSAGQSHDQADAEWVVIRTQLRGHNDTPFGRPAPGRPSGRPGSGRPSGVFCMF